MSVPYATATSGGKAREETIKLLQRFGCERVGFMDNFQTGELILQFVHKGRQVHLTASAAGWAAMYLRSTPSKSRARKSQAQREAWAFKQGQVAINSILRDWVKGQVTAVECGLMPFDSVFFAHMIASDGRSVIEHVRDRKMLPAPTEH